MDLQKRTAAVSKEGGQCVQRPSSRCRSLLNRVLGSYLFAIEQTDMPQDRRLTEGLKVGKLCSRVVMQYGPMC